MKDYNKKLLHLPAKGKAMIITDIHGNIGDYQRYMEIWGRFKNKKNHLIITGDYIHGFGDSDGSVNILESIKWQFEHLPNFHVLLGNHELAQLAGIDVFKGGYNQKKDFETLVFGKYGSKCQKKIKLYKKFFKKLPIAVKTENGVFISHAGPSTHIKSVMDLKNILKDGYCNNHNLSGMLWNRFGDYSLDDVDEFLKAVGCEFSIVGHTPVKGVKKIGEKQLILSSSYGYEPKAYLELDLEKKITSINDLIGMVKYLDSNYTYST